MKQTQVAFRLAKAMAKKKLDGKTLAARSGVAVSGISTYLNSKAEPSRRTAERLAGALGVTVDWLLGVAPLEIESDDNLSKEALEHLYEGLTDKNKRYLLDTAVLLNKVQQGGV